MKGTLVFLAPVALTLGVLAVVHAAVLGPPAPPKMSKVAPAADLQMQVDRLVSDIREGLSDETVYADRGRTVSRDAHTLAVIALVLAKHDEEHSLKASAPALLVAVQALAKAKQYPAAKAAFAAVEAALAGQGPAAAAVEWDRVASQGQLMKQVTFINNRLRRNLRRFEDRAADNARDAAFLAAVGQAIQYDTHEVKDAKDIDKWYEICAAMRDSAGELNAKIHAKDKAGADAALINLGKSCDDCHSTFRVTVMQ